jgi:hypothetical protein
MKAVRKNGVTKLTLEKPEIKALVKAQEILEGVSELGQDAGPPAKEAYEHIELVLQSVSPDPAPVK